MFALLIALAVVGTTAAIAGRVIEYQSEKEKLETEKDLAQRQAALFAEEATFEEKASAEQAAMQREQAALARRETARASSQTLEQATAALGTQTARTAAGGLEEGRSFEQVRKRFERGFATELAGIQERGGLQANQLLRQATLTEEAGSLQAGRLRYNQYAALQQEKLIETQQKWAPWGLALGITTDIAQGGFSFATTGYNLGLWGEK